jgi:hypothetical protein
MRKFLLVLGLAGIVLGLLSMVWSGSGLSFSPFSSEEGKFAILMPAPPEKKTKIVKGLTQITYGASADNCVYSVSYSDLPSASAFNAANSVKAIVKAFGGKVLSDTTCNFAYTKGWQFEAEITKPKGYLSCRIAFINLRYYMILVMGDDSRLSNPNVETFLNSFKRFK